MTDSQMEQATAEQQLGMSFMLLGCAFGGDEKNTPKSKDMAASDTPKPKDTAASDTPSAQIPAKNVPLTLDLSLNQAVYNPGYTAIVIAESNGISENIKLRVTDSNVNVLHQGTITTDEFGTATSEFQIPKYYIHDEPIEVTAFFEKDPAEKRTITAQINALKIDLDVKSDTNKSFNVIAKTESISENIKIRVTDSNAKVIHQDTITTDEFGTATSEFTASKYYLRDEPIEVMAFFENEPTSEKVIPSSIKLTPVKLTFSTDRSEYTYKKDTMTVYVTTDPPISTSMDIVFTYGEGFEECYLVDSRTILTDADGEGEIKNAFACKSKFGGFAKTISRNPFFTVQIQPNEPYPFEFNQHAVTIFPTADLKAKYGTENK